MPLACDEAAEYGRWVLWTAQCRKLYLKQWTGVFLSSQYVTAEIQCAGQYSVAFDSGNIASATF